MATQQTPTIQLCDNVDTEKPKLSVSVFADGIGEVERIHIHAEIESALRRMGYRTEWVPIL